MGDSHFLMCETCSTLIEIIEDHKGRITCCGKPMRHLKAGTVDASREKHVPVARREGDRLIVDIGQVAHPMEEKHYIQGIYVEYGTKARRVILSPGDAPHAEFKVGPEPIKIYAYCNIHGLWEADID